MLGMRRVMVAAATVVSWAVRLDHTAAGGEPLVLIHGIGHTWRGWKPMLPPLEQSFDVLALDMPGFGHSPALPAEVEPTPEALADAVERPMHAAGFRYGAPGRKLAGGLGRAGACPARPRGHGHRYLTGGPGQRARGGMGARRPARASASGPHRSGSRAVAAQPGQPHAVRRTDAGQAVAGRSRRSDRAERPVRRRSRLRPHTAAHHASPGPGPERDPLPGQGRRFERLIPGAELRYLKGLGHVPMSDDPRLLAGADQPAVRAARSGAGVSAAATITSTKAKL
jgi:pimeloyl-ACP methyl ester carboxylesterase